MNPLSTTGSPLGCFTGQAWGMGQEEGIQQGAGSGEQIAERRTQSPGRFPEAEKYYQETITLPLFPDMTEEMQDKVCQVLHDILKIS